MHAILLLHKKRALGCFGKDARVLGLHAFHFWGRVRTQTAKKRSSGKVEATVHNLTLVFVVHLV